jgi:hypothetical protein
LREEFRRAAFVDVDVRALVAEYGAEVRGQCRDRERVRRRAGCDGEDRDLFLEELREFFSDAACDVVAAVACGRSVIGAGEGRENLRRRTGGIVAYDSSGAPRKRGHPNDAPLE